MEIEHPAAQHIGIIGLTVSPEDPLPVGMPPTAPCSPIFATATEASLWRKSDASLFSDEVGVAGTPLFYTKGTLVLARLQRDVPKLDSKRVLRKYLASTREDGLALLLELLAAGAKRTPAAIRADYFEVLDNAALLEP